MAEVAVLVPVLARPQRAKPLADSLRETCGGHVRLIFLCTPGDDAEIKACRKVRWATTEVVPFARGPGDYARKINYGVTITDEPWLFHGADDLRFHEAWLERAMETAAAGFSVVGTNDLGNRSVLSGRHSTHSLVARSYIEEVGTVDEPGKMLHEGYRHNFCDTELVQAAQLRGQFKSAHRAVVEHLHPHWRKADMDATYQLGLADFAHDARLFHWRRQRVWGKQAVPPRLASQVMKGGRVEATRTMPRRCPTADAQRIVPPG
jgi:hypothetical protein